MLGQVIFVVVVLIFVIIRFSSFFGNARSISSVYTNDEEHVNQMNLYSRKSDLNIQITYAYLAGWLMRKNSRDSKAKLDFIRLYFQRHFQKYEQEVQLKLINAMKYETNIRSVAKWITKYLQDGQERIKIIDFLFELAKVDGHIIDREFVAIVRLAELIGVRASYIEKKLKEFNDQQFRAYNESSSAGRSNAKRSKALLELQLTEEFTESQLKRAYRKMAKRYHPDAQTVQSTEERRVANEKFLKIQEAYDYLSGAK